MIISKDKVVSLIYELRIDKADGKIIESLNQDAPLTFLFGSGSLLPKFEDNLAGLKAGDKFSFSLDSEDAYGQYNAGAVVEVPMKAFEVDGKIDSNMIKQGNHIPMQDGHGNRLNGIVKNITAEVVTMDFNHPLAGNNLFFKGEVTGIREATEEEIMHRHSHYSGGCDSCSDCSGHDGHCC